MASRSEILQTTDKRSSLSVVIDSTIYSPMDLSPDCMGYDHRYMVVFIFFAALSLQVAIKPFVDYLYKWGVSHRYGVLLIYLFLIAAVVLLLWFIAPLLITQMVAVITELPDYYAALRDYLVNARSTLLHLVADQLPARLSLHTATASVGEETVDPITPVWEVMKSSGNVFFVLVAILALAFSWTMEGERVIRRLLLRVPQDRREEVRTLIAEMESKIGDYFRGQAILCVIVGVMSLVAFLLLGIPNALVLGALMGIFEALPVIGPTLGAIPAVLLTLAVAPEKTVWVIVALIAIQVVENNLLVPRIMDQSVGVNAIVSILAIAAFGLLFGIGGAILAIPLAAILQILIKRFLFELPPPEDAINNTPLTAPVMMPPNSRDQFGKLRLEAQELAQDIRKQARGEETPADTAAEQIEDLIEAIAVDLDKLLVEAKGRV
jgi:predicted PurR-regulated permease PerM